LTYRFAAAIIAGLPLVRVAAWRRIAALPRRDRGSTAAACRTHSEHPETAMTPAHESALQSPSRRRLAAGAAGLLAGASLPAAAQPAAWPARAVKFVVGFAPGGGTDVMARALAASLSEALGQGFVVDNKPGASGNLSASEVARATPDGYTFLVAPTSVETANPFLFKSSLQPARDLTPVMGVGRMQMYLVARPDLEANDIRQLVALAKSRPGRLNYASSGTATPPHLAGELFKQSTGTFITHVPYRGSAPALQDVMGGQADFVWDPGIAFPHIRAGKVKLLGVASDRKSPFFPDAPTYADLGIRNASLDIWFGVWAPNNVPADVTERLSRELTRALGSAAIKTRFNSLGAEPAPVDAAAFRKLLADETKTLSTLIRERQIIVE
jgi:tripartite-type tricarboxylate transporter receptor subunit TctC